LKLTADGKTCCLFGSSIYFQEKFIVFDGGTKKLQEQLFHRDVTHRKKSQDKTRKTATVKVELLPAVLHRLSQHGGGTYCLRKEVLN